jgi:hypothetical protein
VPYSGGDGLTRGVGETAPGYDSQAVSEGRHGGDSPFDPGVRDVSEHLMLQSGEWVREWRTLESLEQSVDPPEGAHNPRARRSLARGDIQPSSEEELCPRGHPALERGGVSVVWRRVPRARRSFARGVPGPAA